MKNFFTALMTYFNAAPGGVHNDLWNDLGGRLFNTRAPEGAVMPYCVFMLVSAVPEFTFTEEETSIILQFSIFSATQDDDTEVQNAMTHLKALFDNCLLSVTGQALLKFDRGNEGLEVEDFETTTGLQRGWHYHVDYNVVLNKT